MAHQGKLDAPSLLGRKPDRLRQGRHARAAAPGRPARGGTMGAARGAGREAQAGSGHGNRRLGIHAIRRHGLLGKAGIETKTPQDGQLYDSLSAWLLAVRGGASGGVPENIKKIVAAREIETKRVSDQGAQAYFVEHAYTKTAKLLEPLQAKIEQVERHRKELEEQLRPPWSFARRPVRPSLRFCSSAANMTSAARKSSAACRRSCRRFRRAHRSIVWGWHTG